MGISRLGFVAALLSGLVNVVMSLLEPVFNFINKYILGTIFAILWSLIEWAVAIPLYYISCFLLSLVDFVELLFRLLAGLPVDGVRLVLDGTNSDSSDLLIQMILSNEIQQAFMSLCIVGLFLLVITTIFQMIRVEYTSEGAKNAKGPILEKAFKAICNLMLVPLCCVIGISLGNSVLDLLDSATKGGGQNPTVSGALFTAAAGSAFYKTGNMIIQADVIYYPNILAYISPLIAVNVIEDAFDHTAGEANSNWQWEYMHNDKTRQNVENNILNASYVKWDPITALGDGRQDADGGGTPITSSGNWIDDGGQGLVDGMLSQRACYYNAVYVSTYYNISKINYLLLIFGATWCIKTLWHAAFGMISRLFYCTMYFMVAPIVMGMSVIKDNTAAWRGKFIGKALSAYGVIMALNFFFIIIRVLLSVDLEFSKNGAYFLGENEMVLLLKGVFILCGSTMIEKFSGELGGYFGAEDGLSAGKALAKSVGDEAKKGIEVAGKAAMAAGSIALTAGTGGAGGAALGALKGISSAGGVAGKLGGAAGGKVGVKNALGHAFSAPKRDFQRLREAGSNAKASIKQKRDARKVERASEKEMRGEHAKELYNKNTAFTRFRARASEAWHGTDQYDNRRLSAVMKRRAEDPMRDEKIERMSAVQNSQWQREYDARNKTESHIGDNFVGPPPPPEIVRMPGESAGAFNRRKLRAKGHDVPYRQGDLGFNGTTTGEPIADAVASSGDSPTVAANTAPVKSSGDTNINANTVNATAPATTSASGTAAAETPAGDDGKVEPTKMSDADYRNWYLQAGARGLLKNEGMSMLKSTPLAGIFGAMEAFDKGAEAELSKSDTGKAVLEKEKKRKSQKKEAEFERDYATEVEMHNQSVNQQTTAELGKAIKKGTEDLQESIDKLAETMKKIAAREGIYKGMSDEAIQNALLANAQKIESMGGTINGNIQTGNFEVEVDFDTADIEKTLQKAIAENWKPDKLKTELEAQFAKIGQKENDKLLEEIKKAMEKLKDDVKS